MAEDNFVSQNVIRRQLLVLGFEADVVEDGLKTLGAIRRIHYDMILMDCQMPGMDGYATTRMIRSLQASGPRSTIVALTATDSEKERQRCLAAGMDDYIVKPVRQEALSAILKKWKERREEGLDTL